tara:strand:+ start:143 stop:424 length:282 start_codon:yes stop_codon:yes gene_type:complete
MSTRVRIKPVKDAIKDLNYVNDYISEWKNDENVLPTGAHQQRYNIISTLITFALTKLTAELGRSNESITVSDTDGQPKITDSGTEEAESNKNS